MSDNHRKLYMESLGCAKNLVDSEAMLGQLVKAGWEIMESPSKAHVIVVNTCSFIESAINESIDTILDLAKYKEEGSCRRLIVTGCLPERFREELIAILPEIDFFLGTGAFDKITAIAAAPPEHLNCLLPDPNLSLHPSSEIPRVLSSPHSAYIKISEGCSRHCTYCIIPKLRGKQKSRSVDNILAEVRTLLRSDIKELVLIAQDSTAYGKDLNPPTDTGHLLERISEISGDAWIRLLYMHPESIDESIIRIVANHVNICSYFDIPIQHTNDRILKQMGRNYGRDDILMLFDKIRSLIPNAALRTSIIVGFPGETESDFENLLDVVKQIRFDHLGVFEYSGFHDLPSQKLPDHVPQSVAKERYDRLMSWQMEISRDNIKKHVDRTFNVLIEAAPEDNLFIGRTAFQAPEVDGITYVKSAHLSTNRFINVRITDTLEYDLIGEPA